MPAPLEAPLNEAPRQLIVRGDDLGATFSSLEAHRQCLHIGVQTCTELLVLGPWAAHAAQWLRAEPHWDVGLHLALTSEWDGLHWQPLSTCRSLRDQYGRFPAFVTPHQAYPGHALSERPWQADEVAAELRAQVEWGLQLVPHASHLSFHMAFTDLAPVMRELVCTLAEEYGLTIPEFDTQVQFMTYAGPHRTPPEKRSSFLAMLRGLPAQGTFLFVDHPDLNCAETRALGHQGYTEVALDRSGVTALFCDPALPAALEHHAMTLRSTQINPRPIPSGLHHPGGFV